MAADAGVEAGEPLGGPGIGCDVSGYFPGAEEVAGMEFMDKGQAAAGNDDFVVDVGEFCLAQEEIFVGFFCFIDEWEGLVSGFGWESD